MWSMKKLSIFVFEEICTFLVVMTQCKMEVRILSGGVTKILTFHRMSKIDFQPDFSNPQMLSFPNMYNTMGSKVNGLAVREHFLSKSA